MPKNTKIPLQNAEKRGIITVSANFYEIRKREKEDKYGKSKSGDFFTAVTP